MLAQLLLVTIAATAQARPLRVAVSEFDGPTQLSEDTRRIVLDVVDDEHEVVPWKRFLATARRLDVPAYSPRTAAFVARQARVDAVVEGEVAGEERHRLLLTVREARSGRVVDTVDLTLPPRPGDGTREEVADELLQLLDSTDPLEEEIDRSIASPPWTEGALLPVPARAAAAVSTPARARESAFAISGGVGLAASRRQLKFFHSATLAPEESPQGIRGNPGAGVAVCGRARVAPLGLSLTAAYERSVGARLGYRDAGAVRELAVAQRQLAVGVRAGARLGRLTFEAGLGYRELAYLIANKPGTLLIPDARYTFAEVGGGLRVSLKDQRVALVGEGAYLHALSSSGITDAKAYGRAGVSGMRADLALEVQVSDSMLLRVGGGYTRVVLVFAGDGEAPDADAATDVYAGGYLLFGFLL